MSLVYEYTIWKLSIGNIKGFRWYFDAVELGNYSKSIKSYNKNTKATVLVKNSYRNFSDDLTFKWSTIRIHSDMLQIVEL